MLTILCTREQTIFYIGQGSADAHACNCAFLLHAVPVRISCSQVMRLSRKCVFFSHIVKTPSVPVPVHVQDTLVRLGFAFVRCQA
jgi:hypothetical protein